MNTGAAGGSGQAEAATFYALDGLRGAAAIAVLMTHAAALFRPVWVRSAYLAVDLFFVLSGFVLAHAYGRRLRSGLPVATFLRMRLQRIMPLYLLGTAIAVGDALVQHAIGRGGWDGAALLRSGLAAAVLLPLPPATGAGPFAFPLNIPAWSLFFELAVNGVYAGLCPILTARRTGALTGVALVTLVATCWHFGGLSTGATWATFWTGAPRVMFSFFAGVLVYRQVMRANGRLHAFNPWLVLPGLLLLFYMPMPHALRPVFDLGCVAVLFPWLIFHGGRAEAGGSRERRICAMLGRVSFALYAVHVPLLGVAENLLADNGVGPAWRAPFTGLLFLGLVCGCSYAADRWFDRPIQRWFRRPRNRPAAAIAPAMVPRPEPTL